MKVRLHLSWVCLLSHQSITERIPVVFLVLYFTRLHHQKTRHNQGRLKDILTWETTRESTLTFNGERQARDCHAEERLSLTFCVIELLVCLEWYFTRLPKKCVWYDTLLIYRRIIICDWFSTCCTTGLPCVFLVRQLNWNCYSTNRIIESQYSEWRTQSASVRCPEDSIEWRTWKMLSTTDFEPTMKTDGSLKFLGKLATKVSFATQDILTFSWCPHFDSRRNLHCDSIQGSSVYGWTWRPVCHDGSL